jgi:hypothetical protein
MTRRKSYAEKFVGRYLKAIVAFLAPVLAGIQTDLASGLTLREMMVNSATGFLTALVVWAVPNSQT